MQKIFILLISLFISAPLLAKQKVPEECPPLASIKQSIAAFDQAFFYMGDKTYYWVRSSHTAFTLDEIDWSLFVHPVYASDPEEALEKGKRATLTISQVVNTKPKEVYNEYECAYYDAAKKIRVDAVDYKYE